MTNRVGAVTRQRRLLCLASQRTALSPWPFVPRQFLEQLGKDRIIDVALGGQVQREMTVLFSDIRDFTRMSEGMTPAETFSFINQHPGAIEPAISDHRGIIDRYIGDAVMALFPNQADDAVYGALEMIRRLDAWNAQRVRKGEQPTEIGIGVHTGRLTLEMVGARDRMDTTVIPDAVNLASRVENLTKTYRVPLIITEETYLALHEPTAISARRIDRVLVRGKSQPVALNWTPPTSRLDRNSRRW